MIRRVVFTVLLVLAAAVALAWPCAARADEGDRALVLSMATAFAPQHDHEELVRFVDALDSVVEANGPLFAGPEGKQRTLALMTSIAFFESSFRLDATGDHGRSTCWFQIMGGGAALRSDAMACAQRGYAFLRASLRACGTGDELGLYAAGKCGTTTGKRISRHRLYWARKRLQDAMTKEGA